MILREKQKVAGSIAKSVGLNGAINNKSSVISGKTNVGTVFKNDVEPIPEYTESYSVTPSLFEQVLQTANKLMTDNLTVKEIPYAEVSNNSGGLTVTIGGE